jgi:tRNA 5-methylaminomethyl-2-thiouridine biosynthesis bifunctional protein
LCVGPLEPNLKEIDIAVDSMCLANFDGCDARSIARLSKLGTQVCWKTINFNSLTQFKELGFEVNESQLSAVYKPRWEFKSSLRSSVPQAHQPLRNAVVIGAGLAGSAVAYSLAQRGVQVLVIDEHPQTGGGASGLPAGIFATHVSLDNNVLSRITRDGVRATIQRTTDLLKRGQEWELSHLLEHQYRGQRSLPAGKSWLQSGLIWSAEAQAEQKELGGLLPETPALWHHTSGWIQTPALVKAQLNHVNIECRFGIKVAKLVREQSTWLLLDKDNETVAEANCVVIANAHACQDLLNSVHISSSHLSRQRPLIPITPLRGQVTLGDMNLISKGLQEKLPHVPVNGHGSFIGYLPNLNDPLAKPYWLIGASFQRHELDTSVREEDQQTNLQQWAELMPAWHDEILKNVDVSKANAWAGIRASLPDRLPVVGAFDHPDFKGLQMCTAMGARGISWSVLCGEILASLLNHEPLPVAASMAKRLTASRFG